MVYKHAVSTIIPVRPIPDFSLEKKRGIETLRGLFSIYVLILKANNLG